MTEVQDWQKDLLAEQSLWDVFRGSRKLGATKTNAIVRILFLIVSSAIALWAAFEVGRIPNSNIMALIIWMASSTLGLSVSVLGFLIAGFSVFVTLSDRKLLIELAKTPYADYGISVFKYIFFSFMVVFIYFLQAIVITYAVGAFAQIKWDSNLIPFSRNGIRLANISIVWLLSLLFVELMIRLKSFIWAIYSSFISKLVVEDLISEELR